MVIICMNLHSAVRHVRQSVSLLLTLARKAILMIESWV